MKLNLGKKTREKHSSPPPTFKNASIFLITLICVLSPCCLEFAYIKGLSGVFHHIVPPSLSNPSPSIAKRVCISKQKQKKKNRRKNQKNKNSKSAFYSNSNDKKYDYKSYHHFEHGIN